MEEVAIEACDVLLCFVAAHLAGFEWDGSLRVEKPERFGPAVSDLVAGFIGSICFDIVLPWGQSGQFDGHTGLEGAGMDGLRTVALGQNVVDA